MTRLWFENGKIVDEVHKRFWRLDWMFLEAFGKVSQETRSLRRG